MTSYGICQFALMLVMLPDVFCFVFLQQLQLGDIVISVEMAQRQAEERGHTLLDETRILMVRPCLG
jgi:ssRNA-specific RNase YbeY (16S rRNA maturation enzyme)